MCTTKFLLNILVISFRAELQVRTTQDYCTDSWIWYFLSGGLNHQTAHHLFPGTQHNNIITLGCDYFLQVLMFNFFADWPKNAKFCTL